MNPQDYLKADLLDIIFEGRNKAYGAYNLRKIYQKHARNSLIIGSLAILLMVAAPLIYSKIRSNMDDSKKMVSTEVNLSEFEIPKDVPPPPPPPPPKEAPKPPQATVKYVAPKPVPPTEADPEPPKPPTPDQNPGAKDDKGSGDPTPPSAPAGDGDKPAPPPPPVVEDKPEEIFTIVEQKAEFPDGEAAMYKWLGENIKYPAVARENGIQGKVFLRFIVEKDGSIQQVTVLKSPNDLLSEEAKRVIAKMPKWNAGKQRGNSVRSYFTLPVNFKLEG